MFWSNDGFWRLRVYQLLEHDHAGVYVNHPVNLTSDAPRWEFTERFGFDPAAGLVLEEQATRDATVRAWVGSIITNVASLSPIPVYDFRPGDDRVDWLGGGRDPREPLSAASGSPKPAASGAASAR